MAMTMLVDELSRMLCWKNCFSVTVMYIAWDLASKCSACCLIMLCSHAVQSCKLNNRLVCNACIKGFNYSDAKILLSKTLQARDISIFTA